jgi:nitrate reductase / nitrite oxidoreductase, beta subunit
MTTAYNWQLGRDMEYRFEGGGAKRQFAAVFNINRCIACQTCTMACRSTWTFSPGQELMWWNNVETKPYGGYPRHWDVNLLELLERGQPGGSGVGRRQRSRTLPTAVRGKTVFEAAGPDERASGTCPPTRSGRPPTASRTTAPVVGQGASLPEHEGWFFYLARICNHCTYPACLAACPRNAIYKRPEDGIVLIDQERCRGYRKCVEACPYKKAMYRPTTGTSEKCIGCYPRVEGTDPLTNGSRWRPVHGGLCRQDPHAGSGEVEADGTWAEDPDHPLYFLVHEEKVALPLYPQFGTQPNIYYIPPRWVPRDYLRQMFGPGVDRGAGALHETVPSLLAVLQLFRASQQMIFSFDVEEGPRRSGESKWGGAVRDLQRHRHRLRCSTDTRSCGSRSKSPARTAPESELDMTR